LNRIAPFAFKREFSFGTEYVGSNIIGFEREIFTLCERDKVIKVFDSKNGHFIRQFDKQNVSIGEIFEGQFVVTDQYIFLHGKHLRYNQKSKNVILMFDRKNGAYLKNLFDFASCDSKDGFKVTNDKIYITKTAGSKSEIYVFDRV